MNIRTEDVFAARRGIRAILDYQHPGTLAGVRSDAMIELMILDGRLKKLERETNQAIEGMILELGEEKIPGRPETSRITKDSPNQSLFYEARRRLLETEIDVGDVHIFKVSEFDVRDENGELVRMDCGRIADLGPFLSTEREEPAAPKKVEKLRPQRRR